VPFVFSPSLSAAQSRGRAVWLLPALALLEKHEQSAGQIERELGITPGLLVKWRARFQAVQGGNGAVHLEPSDIVPRNNTPIYRGFFP
jgi:hypothetical protein